MPIFCVKHPVETLAKSRDIRHSFSYIIHLYYFITTIIFAHLPERLRAGSRSIMAAKFDVTFKDKLPAHC